VAAESATATRTADQALAAANGQRRQVRLLGPRTASTVAPLKSRGILNMDTARDPVVRTTEAGINNLAKQLGGQDVMLISAIKVLQRERMASNSNRDRTPHHPLPRLPLGDSLHRHPSLLHPLRLQHHGDSLPLHPNLNQLFSPPCLPANQRQHPPLHRLKEQHLKSSRKPLLPPLLQSRLLLW